MLTPEDRWIWDFWHVEDQGLHHLYYLHAPKSLGDPGLRHRAATIGHATSTDLVSWTEHGTVLTPGRNGAIDATATWTGSVVRGADGTWRMFYTGSTFPSDETAENIEVIGAATSPDLYTWTKDSTFALRAEAGLYETLGSSDWPEECWRDPWVYREGDGQWHMLITARAPEGALLDRGVVGHATSDDLVDWTIRPPLTQPGYGFGQLEVLQRATIDDEQFAVFSVHDLAVTPHRRAHGSASGTWIAPWTDRIRLDQAHNLTGPDFYSGRVVDLDGEPVLLAFRMGDDGTTFIGGVTDPMSLTRRHGQTTLSDNLGVH